MKLVIANEYGTERVRAEIDGRAMFEISVGDDGRSIDIRSPEVTRVDGVLYSNRLVVEPQASNSIRIAVNPWSE